LPRPLPHGDEAGRVAGGIGQIRVVDANLNLGVAVVILDVDLGAVSALSGPSVAVAELDPWVTPPSEPGLSILIETFVLLTPVCSACAVASTAVAERRWRRSPE
jgi:hypothetical protein